MRLSPSRVVSLGLLLAFASALFAPQALAQSDARKSRDAKAAAKKEAAKKEADKRAAERRAAAKKNAARTPARKPTAEQVSRVNKFVKQHMPELAELLQVLKDAEPNRYAAAIRELYIATDRLERMKPRDPAGYKLSLRSWKLEKQLQLLAARIRMDDSMDGEAELKRLLEERYQTELKIMVRNRDKLAARLKKMDEDIARRKNTHQDQIGRLVKNWTRSKNSKASKTSAVSDRRPKKPAKKPAGRGKTETKSNSGAN